MKVQYQKGKYKRFMILDGDKYPENYETEMMRSNNINALLPFYAVEKDGKTQYWYDITGQKSLEEYLIQEGIDLDVLYKIFVYLKLAVDEIQNYLIAEEHILMQPDTVFIKKENEGGIGLCYFPQNNTDIPLLPIGEYLINNTDHRDKEVTLICYKLYEMIQEPGFLYTDLISEIDSQMGKKEDVEDSMGDKIIRSTFSEERDSEIEIKDTYEIKYADADDHSNSKKFNFFTESITALKKRMSETKGMIIKRLYELFPQIRDMTGRNLDNKKENAVGRLIYEGNAGESDFCIDQNVFNIGRDKNRSDAFLHSTEISRRHSIIERKNGRFYLKDLNSKRGTYHNGRRLEHGEYVILEEMDTISFADVPYRFA